MKEPLEFQWDSANREKIWKKHQITSGECEESFFDYRKKIAKDTLHSDKEERYILLGATKNNKILFIVFTIRSNNVRVISARPINKKERKLYA